MNLNTWLSGQEALRNTSYHVIESIPFSITIVTIGSSPVVPKWGGIWYFSGGGGMAAFVIFYFSAYLCIVYINYVFHVIVFNNLHIHASKLFECSRNVIVHICSDTFI